MTTQSLFSRRITQILLGALALAAITIPVLATPTLWNWSDKSNLLPVQYGVSLNLVSERAGEWLVSDGSHLYKYDGDNVKDLTKELRAKGLLGVSSISSDDQYWLITYKPLDQSQPIVWLTDGENWIEASQQFSYAQGGLDAVGHDGQWFVRTYDKPQSGHPSNWTLYRWSGAQTQPEKITIPLDQVAPLAAGCTKDLAGSILCTGVSTPIYVNGNWYFIGGTSQLQGTITNVLQTPSTHLWNINNNVAWKEISMPNVKFVSGVWQHKDSVLIATSDAVSNPFASDRFWTFDGKTMRDVSSQALGAGLLSTDAREIKASWNGRAWVIVGSNKNLVRFDGKTMTRQTPATDLFNALASNDNGLTVLVGAASETNSQVPSTPLTAKLVLMQEDFTQNTTVAPSVSNLAEAVVSKTFGPRVQIASNPSTNRIGNGQTFVFQAKTNSNDDIDHIDIYVNGARIKSCFDNECIYSQTYWTQGAQTRRVQLFARAINRDNFANDSATITLIVDANSTASASVTGGPVPAVVSADALPKNLSWTTDTGTGIAWATWINPNQTTLKNQPVTYNVTARASKGLNKIELWVNGAVKDTCVFDSVVTENRGCRVSLVPSDLPNNASVFVNARILDSRGLETWTTGVNFVRERSSITSATVTNTNTEAPTATGPVFTASATLTPNTPTILRGNTVVYHVIAQNNTKGLHSIEVLVNGSVKRACSYGAAVSAVPCDVTIDTSNYQPGSNISFLARAIDNNGQETWADAKAIVVSTVSDPVTNTDASAKAGNNLSVWSWMTPAQDTISVNETVSYTAGAWAPSGIKSIEMLVDGVVKKTCAFGTQGTKECVNKVTTNDYSDEHMVVMNARVTAMDGSVSWTDVRMVTLKRTWNPLSNPPSYAQVTTNRTNGYAKNDQISITLRGWSPRGVDHLDLFVNSKKVFTCPTTNCVYTTPVYNQAALEYQVRMVDTLGQESWSGLYGIHQK